MPTVSPNMGLTIPTVSQTPGPEWASNINSSLSLVDSHDHSSGRGVPVTPAGMSISSALTFQGNAATDVSRLGLSQLGATLGVTTLRSVYSVGSSGDLYYNNGTGTPVQITNGASLAGAAGTISGLPFGTASASFASDTFTWQQSTGIGAIMDSGPLKVRRAAASANYIQIQPPAAMAANWNLTLPPSPPASQAVMTVSNTGTATHATVDGTLTLTPSLLKVGVIQTANINDGAVTAAKLAALGQAFSASSGSSVQPAVASFTAITNLSLPVYSVNSTRPILLSFQNDENGSFPSYFYVNGSSGDFYIQATGPSGTAKIAFTRLNANTISAPSSIQCLYVPPSIGLYSFTLYGKNNGGGSITTEFVKLVVTPQ